MASTYSSLKIELIGTGEQAGAWGATTNTNLGTAIEQAITGSVSVAFASADVTLTLTDTNVAQNARALRLDLVGTSGGARNLFVPAIAKQYIVNNGLADTVTIKNATGTGIAIPSGRTMVVFNNATNVVDVTTYATSLTLGAALPVSSGGTGQTSYTDGQLLIGNTTGNTLAKSTLTAGSGISITNGSGSITIAATGGGGTVTSVTASAPLASSGGTTPNLSLTGTVGVGNGGTGQTSYTDGQLLIGNTTGNTLAKSTLTASTGISVTNGSGAITLTANYTEAVVALATSGSIALSTASGTVQTCALSGNPTFTDSLSSGQSLVLMLTNGSSYTVVFPTITWVSPIGNVAPSLTAKDTLVFWKISTTLYGAYVGSFV
jgi:hypothetical protein